MYRSCKRQKKKKPTEIYQDSKPTCDRKERREPRGPCEIVQTTTTKIKQKQNKIPVTFFLLICRVTAPWWQGEGGPWTVGLLGTAQAPPSSIWPLAVPWQQAQMQMFLGWDHLSHSSWPGLVSYRSSQEKELSLPAQVIPSLTFILRTFWALQELWSPDPLVHSFPLPAFIELRGRED